MTIRRFLASVMWRMLVRAATGKWTIKDTAVLTVLLFIPLALIGVLRAL